MNDSVPRDIVLATKKSIYVIAFLSFCIFSFSVVLLVRHNEDTTDAVLSSLNLSIPFILLAFCYIIWDNQDFYTSTRVAQAYNKLTQTHYDLNKNHQDLHNQLKETLNCSKNKTKEDIVKAVKNIQTNNKNELQQM